jgi:hypothetical protein
VALVTKEAAVGVAPVESVALDSVALAGVATAIRLRTTTADETANLVARHSIAGYSFRHPLRAPATNHLTARVTSVGGVGQGRNRASRYHGGPTSRWWWPDRRLLQRPGQGGVVTLRLSSGILFRTRPGCLLQRGIRFRTAAGLQNRIICPCWAPARSPTAPALTSAATSTSRGGLRSHRTVHSPSDTSAAASCN